MTPASEIRPAPLPRPWTLGRIRLPEPALGDLYRFRGIAWGRLQDRNGFRLPSHWRELVSQRNEA